MKKTLRTLLVLLTAVCLIVSLAACGDKSGAIKKAFEDAGYTVTSAKATDDSVKGLLDLLLNDEQMKEAENYEIILCKVDGLLNIGKTAVVLKVPSAGDLKNFLTVEDKDGKKDTSVYDKAVEDGKINGNCMIFTASSESLEVFKKA